MRQMTYEFYHYYVKNRVFEWSFALATFFAGFELLIWDQVLTFGAFRWMTQVLTQKQIGTLMLMLGWIRVSALMFNGQLLFGRKVGWMVRAVCAVLSASLWAQFSFSLFQLSFDQGFPSLGLPFWTIFIGAELLVAYSVGAEWKK
jgi:hypothetical protein